MHIKTVYYGVATRTVVTALVIAFVASGWVYGQDAPPPLAPSAYKAEELANRGLDANLYMETSAEYRACCYQAYNLALFRLKAAMAQAKSGNFAVVMDLDETAVDNSGFQAMQFVADWPTINGSGMSGRNKALTRSDLSPGQRNSSWKRGSSAWPSSISVIATRNSGSKPRRRSSDSELSRRPRPRPKPKSF